MRQSVISNVLIGHSGFVGSTLQTQTPFGALYRSSNISDIRGKEFDILVCAAAPGQKWIANREPLADRQNIERLIAQLKTVSCRIFILVSTVDVFKNPVGIDEMTSIEEDGLHPYGLHRRQLEKFVQQHFANHLIVRLPGLVGPGLRKNIIFDFHNGNNVQAIDSRSVFQFYPMVNLWCDIQAALLAGLQIVHLTAEPISVGEVSLQGFGKPFTQRQSSPPARYDLRTRHASLFGAAGNYQYSQRETVQAVRSYAQSEPLTLKPQAGTNA